MESWGDLAKQLWWEMTPQTNYHGTPYSFDKFDDSKFLTGEGFNAHGPGHYSADYITTAKQYKPTGEYFTYNIINKANNNPLILNDTYSVPWGKSAKFNMHKDDIMHYLAEALRKNKKNVDAYYTYSMVNQVPEASHVLNNLQDYELVKERHTGNLYKVNVPNENFMWKERMPINFQSDYIKDRVIPSVNEIKNIKNIEDLDDVVYKFTMLDDRYDPLSIRDNVVIKRIQEGKIKPSRIENEISRIKNRLIEERSVLASTTPRISDRMAENLKDYGIKGVRAIGHQDGPINVTFSGKDIRMANTMPQQIRNRIPVQTLGKMARKLYNYPVIKGGIKFLDMFGPALMVPDIIKQQGLYPYTNKEKQRIKNILEKKYGIKINGNKITI